MPKAKPRGEPQDPAPLQPLESDLVKRMVRRFYGEDAVVRNYGPDPKQLWLHVESDKGSGLHRDECLGHLLCDIVRDRISIDDTKRGERIRGNAKVAYRQGVIL